MNPLSFPKEGLRCEKLNMDEEIERLIEVYGNDVLRTCYLYLKDIHRAEDAFQEVFIKVYNKYNSFRGESSEKTWIMRITINVCKDMLKTWWLKRVFVSENPMPEEEFQEETEKAAIKSIESKILFKEVSILKQSLKDVVILYYYHQFDSREISEILGIAEGTVRSRLHRAREILKNKLVGRIEHYD